MIPACTFPDSYKPKTSNANNCDMKLQCQLILISVVCCGFLLASLETDADEKKPSAQNPKNNVPADHAKRVKKGTALFKSQVRGILTKHCLDCHGGKSVKADFDLSTRKNLFASGYVEDTAEDSHLMKLITHAEEPHMPLKADRLPQASIDRIREWIDLGAPFDKPLGEGKSSERPKALTVTDHDRKFWAFQPLKKSVPVPKVKETEWCRTPIDRFILAKQEAAGLRPNPQAEKRTLIRRATFDQLGLPATPEEVEAFLADNSPHAWESVVDRLLKSDHYGERWARHWMDVARFAESHGYEQDYNRPHAYHFRDFLIKAFNGDMPFDQFVQWQLAGDELAPENPLALMATGFLGAGAFPTQLTEAEFESARYDELDDIVTTTGVAFLGLSIGCARCHDHKYDPIPSRDYYRLAATFTTAIRSEIELDLKPEENQQRKIAWDAKRTEFQQQLSRYEQEQVPQAFAKWIAKYDPKKSQSPWEILRVVEVQSTGGSKFKDQGDGSWLAVGKAPAKEVLTIIAESSGSSASKLRLEALTHKSLPHNGPGRANNGNFALGNVEVSAVKVGEAKPSRNITLTKAVATHQQNADSLSVKASIDPDPISGWAVDRGGIGKDQAAVFEFANPVMPDGPIRWTIRLTFNHPNTRHAIGRFRLSVSDRKNAPVAVGGEELDPKIQAALAQAKAQGDHDSQSWKTAQAWFTKTLPEWQRLNEELKKHREKGPDLKQTKVMVTSEGLPHMKHHADGRGFPHFYPQTYILSRGDVHQKQEVATAGFLQVLTPTSIERDRWQVTPPEQSRTSFRRTALANWMTDTQQGAGSLVARVIVNRVWQHHFGRGLVATPNDFGVSGERPSHPELLEWLANDLIEHNWQLKRLHRMILTSSVYLQSADHNETRAKIDRENTLLWRWEPRRLEAEAIRDSLLAISGMLDRTMFGPGTLDQNMKRRSVYFFIKRSQLIPMMMLFDWPEHLVSIGQRSSTTIAPQALMFLNSPQGRQFAQAFASRLPRDSTPAVIKEAYRLAFARKPTDQETALMTAFLKRQESIYQEQNVKEPKRAAMIDLCQALMSMNEFVYIE